MTYRLRWKCDGICGKTLTEEVDKILVFESGSKGVMEGQIWHLCPQCCEANIKLGGLKKAILIGAKD